MFYSVLVGKSAQYGVATITASFIAILMVRSLATSIDSLTTLTLQALSARPPLCAALALERLRELGSAPQHLSIQVPL